MPELRFSACPGAILDAKLQPFIWWDKRTRNKFLKDQTHYIIEFVVSVFISRALKMLNIIGYEIKRSRSISSVSYQNVFFSFFKSTRLNKLNACANYRSWQLAVKGLSLCVAAVGNCKVFRHGVSDALTIQRAFLIISRNKYSNYELFCKQNANRFINIKKEGSNYYEHERYYINIAGARAVLVKKFAATRVKQKVQTSKCSLQMTNLRLHTLMRGDLLGSFKTFWVFWWTFRHVTRMLRVLENKTIFSILKNDYRLFEWGITI